MGGKPEEGRGLLLIQCCSPFASPLHLCLLFASWVHIHGQKRSALSAAIPVLVACSWRLIGSVERGKGDSGAGCAVCFREGRSGRQEESYSLASCCWQLEEGELLVEEIDGDWSCLVYRSSKESMVTCRIGERSSLLLGFGAGGRHQWGLEQLLFLGFHDRQVEPTVTVSN